MSILSCSSPLLSPLLNSHWQKYLHSLRSHYIPFTPIQYPSQPQTLHEDFYSLSYIHYIIICIPPASCCITLTKSSIHLQGFINFHIFIFPSIWCTYTYHNVFITVVSYQHHTYVHRSPCARMRAALRTYGHACIDYYVAKVTLTMYNLVLHHSLPHWFTFLTSLYIRRHRQVTSRLWTLSCGSSRTPSTSRMS